MLQRNGQCCFALTVFQQTFELLDKAVGPDGFRKYDVKQNLFQGAFLISAYEAVAFGVAFNIELWRAVKKAEEKVAQRVQKLWANPSFTEHIGTGVAARPRLQRTIPFGREFFKP